MHGHNWENCGGMLTIKKRRASCRKSAPEFMRERSKAWRSKSNNNLYADKSPEKYDFYTMQPLLARREVESLALVDPPPCISASHWLRGNDGAAASFPFLTRMWACVVYVVGVRPACKRLQRNDLFRIGRWRREKQFRILSICLT